MKKRIFVNPTAEEIDKRKKMYEEAASHGIDLMGFDLVEGKIKMTRGERRRRKRLKIAKRKEILNATGYQQGTLYEKHIDKIKNSDGYMSKHGTLLHYARGSMRTEKTRDRNSYSGTNNWSYKDRRQMIDGDEQILEYEKSNGEILKN